MTTKRVNIETHAVCVESATTASAAVDSVPAMQNNTRMFAEYDGRFDIINMNSGSSGSTTNCSKFNNNSRTNNSVETSTNNFFKNNKKTKNKNNSDVVDRLLIVDERITTDADDEDESDASDGNNDDEIRLTNNKRQYNQQKDYKEKNKENSFSRITMDGSESNNICNGTNKSATSGKSESYSFYLDHEATMEAPLLDNSNDNDHDYDVNRQSHTHHQHLHEHQQNICNCHQPGFDINRMDKSAEEAKSRIILAISLCTVFMIIEFLGGYFAGSLAIVTDAAHLASDCISFVIGLISIWLGCKAPDRKMSFGYKRMEVMGAIISIWSIWLLTATLVLAAVQRLYSNDYDIDAKTMMIISGIGIIINVIMAYILHGSPIMPGTHHGHTHSQSCRRDIRENQKYSKIDDDTLAPASLKHLQTKNWHERNLNLRAATIHVIGDLVQSSGVFLAAIFIHFIPSAKFMDPVCTILFSVIVLLTTVGLFKESIWILADAVPKDISISELKMDLANIAGVKSVHHLNVWKHTTNYNVMMVHLVVDSDSEIILQKATTLASTNYRIKHSTVQIERLRTEEHG